jgi:hypothetical protein
MRKVIKNYEERDAEQGKKERRERERIDTKGRTGMERKKNGGRVEGMKGRNEQGEE